MEQGIILKGVGGIYEVQTEQGLVFCTLRGRLRLKDRRVLVGDRVRISRQGTQGVVEKILPRQTELRRPPIANVQQALVVGAVCNPPVNLLLVDRILVNAHFARVAGILVFNKKDLAGKKAEELRDLYARIPYTVLITSAKNREGLEELKEVLKGKISTLAGPSGVGKSSLLKALEPSFDLEIQEISAKAQRGRHTTKTVHLLPVAAGLVADTPGFSRVGVEHIPPEELQDSFPEIGKLKGGCQFRGCLHHHEPGCAVKEAVRQNLIAAHRYKHYLIFLREIQTFAHY